MLEELPRSELTDRVDVLRRPSFVQDKLIQGADENEIAFSVPCKILESTSQRTLSMLGTSQENVCQVFFESEPAIRADDILKVIGSDVRYVVRIARKFPSPNNCRFQVCDASQDMLSGDGE